MLRCLALILMIATPAQAQMLCGERDAVTQSLTGVHGETLRGIGLAHEGAVVEVWAAEDGAWTITVTLPAGVTCVIGSGEAYQSLDGVAPVEGDPA